MNASIISGAARVVRALGLGLGLLAAFPIAAQSARHDAVRARMSETLSDESGRPVHSFLLFLENGTDGFCLVEAVRTREADPEAQFKIGSITKTLVATAILRLVEQGRVALEEPAMTYLDEAEWLRFDAIHIMDGENHAAAITVRQLLRHQSGIADIFTDAETRFNLSVLAFRRRQFSPERIARTFYRYRLNERPHFSPGEGYFYSDMNYVALGAIIERVTGTMLAQAIRTLVLEPADMANTYFEYYESPTGHGRLVDQYLNRINVTQRINTSYEWAGGGHASTIIDLSRFLDALFSGKLESPSTLAEMSDTTATRAHGGEYGMGLSEYEIAGHRYWGHGGFWGTLMLHDPKSEITFVANLAQANAAVDAEQLVADLLQLARGE